MSDLIKIFIIILFLAWIWGGITLSVNERTYTFRYGPAPGTSTTTIITTP